MGWRRLLGIGSFFPAALWAETITLDPSQLDFNISNHTLFTNSRNLDEAEESAQLVRSETHVRAEARRYSLGLILSNRVATARPDGADVPIYLEKAFVSYENENVQLTAGDNHLELGRGLSLALFRDEILGIDNSIQGASVRVTPGPWEMRVVGGRARSLRNPVNLFPFANSLYNRNLWLATALTRYKAGAHTVGAHYLLSLNQPFDLGGSFDKRWHTMGASYEGVWGREWNSYFETNTMLSQDLQGPTAPIPQAFASYASIVYSPLPWKIKVEAKDYRNYAYDFHRPPTMEEDIVTSLNFQDVTGTRLWLERRMGVYNSVRTSLLLAHDRTLSTGLWHAVSSAKWKVATLGFEGRAGYRSFYAQQNVIHGDIHARIPTFRGQVFEMGYRKLRTVSNINLGFPTLDDRNYFDLGYTFSAHWSLNVGYEFVPSNIVEVGQHFYHAGTLLKFDAFTSRAFVGSTAGGPQCSGGICRMIPPYSGLMLEGTYAF